MGNKEKTTKKIILAAIEEFCQKGYDNASTNIIAVRAKVSKGVIFLHFSNKEELFLSCLRSVIAAFGEAASALDLSVGKDIFEKLSTIVTWKNRFFRENPIYAKFIVVSHTLKESELKTKVLQHINNFSLPFQKAVLEFEFNPTLYRDNINKEKVLNVIFTVLAGFEAKYNNLYDKIPEQALFDEWNDLLEVIKHGVMR